MNQPTGAPEPVPAPSTWAPLRSAAFRALWIAVTISNIGTWMQTVGAQWLLVDEPGASTLVSLVQTASTLPVLLLALPAGVLADSFDRRRMLIAVQAFQVVVAGTLALLTAAGQMSPALLLTLTFALGCGAAVTAPTYQALIPELVSRQNLPSASALGAISANVARAVGPAVAGVLIAQVGAAAVFWLNAVSFAVFAFVLIAWRRGQDGDAGEPEPFLTALRTGGRYVRYSPVLRRILLRALLFVVPAVSMWGLLPLVASRNLGLDAGGYGLLLAALGVGAVGGAIVLPRLRARLSGNRLILIASLVYAGALAVLALVRIEALVVAALVPAGTAWIAVLSSVNASVQLFLPGWVRARGLAAYQIVFFGGQAVGAALWGLIADQVGVATTLLAAAVVGALGAATLRIWPLTDHSGLDRSPAVYWPEPQLAVDPEPDLGPVLVTAIYTVRPENDPEFQRAMQYVRRSRLRTGAVRWGLYRDGAAPHRLVEYYVVPSWDEHLRQHGGRLTGSDQESEQRARQLADGPPEVAHLFPAEAVAIIREH